MQAPGDSLKGMETEINRVKNRLRKLQRRKQGERQSLQRNQIMKDEAMLKKISMAESLLSEEQEIELQKRAQDRKMHKLKQRNARMRDFQKQQLENVMKAVYIVKSDDAREARRISEEHRNKIRELSSENLEQNKSRRQRIRSENGKAEQFWKEKISQVYLQNHIKKIQTERAVSHKQKQLEDLIRREQGLKEELQINHLRNSHSKRQYVGMMSLPLRQVATVLELHGKKKGSSSLRARSGGSIDRKAKDLSEEIQPIPEQHIFPKTEVSDLKLKIVLEKLRKRGQ